jgi:hypothetical protein
MKINRILSGVYSVIDHAGKKRLVRIIGEYKTEEEANRDLYDILMNYKTESEVEKEKGITY